MARRFAAAVPVALVAWLAVAVSAAAPPAQGAPAPSAALPRVTLIGDSVASALAYDEVAQSILGEGVDLRLELAVCRRVAQESCPYEGTRPPNVIELVTTLGPALGRTVIVSVGYNDFENEYAHDIEAALDAFEQAGVEHVLWATLRAAHHGYVTMNDAIEAAAEHHPELTVVDWNLYSRSHPDWFQQDGLHLYGEGARRMATLFHDALATLGIPVTPPHSRLQIAPARLPPAPAGKAFAVRLTARGGHAPYRWSRGRVFPSWLRLTTRGRLSGSVRSLPGRVAIIVRVTDSAGASASRRFTLHVLARATAGRARAVAATAAMPTSRANGPAAPPPPPRVTMITDSVGGVLYWVGNARDELAAGLDFRLETRACRKLVSLGCYAYEGSPPSVLETVRTLGPELGRIVVVDVGYNDVADGYAADLDTIVQTLAGYGVDRVIWVTLEEAQGNWAEINREIRAAPSRWPALVVADWAAASAGHPDWFADGVHMNAAGGEAFARFLRPVLLEACGAPCAPPPSVVTGLRAVVRPRDVVVRWLAPIGAAAYDVAVRRSSGGWRTVATRLTSTSHRLPRVRGVALALRVRARSALDVPGPWSAPVPVHM